MTNALTVYDNGGFELMQRSAQAMVQSGYFKDSRDVAQAVVKVMAGAELGIAPFAAMTGIHIVQGRPTLSSNLIATLVKNDGRYNYRVKVATDTECVLTWFEDGQACGESSFTMKEANGAGLTGKQVWKQYPSDMLFARALTRGARRFAPGIFGGAPVYTPEEMGADENEAGDIIDVTPQKQNPVVNMPDAVSSDIDLGGDGRSRMPRPLFDHSPMPVDERAETSPQAQAERQPMTAKKRKEFHAIGTEAYGPDWDDKRKAFCAALGVESSNDLTMAQAQKLIDGMRKKLEG
jgi:hypothetical protein